MKVDCDSPRAFIPLSPKLVHTGVGRSPVGKQHRTHMSVSEWKVDPWFLVVKLLVFTVYIGLGFMDPRILEPFQPDKLRVFVWDWVSWSWSWPWTHWSALNIHPSSWTSKCWDYTCAPPGAVCAGAGSWAQGPYTLVNNSTNWATSTTLFLCFWDRVSLCSPGLKLKILSQTPECWDKHTAPHPLAG